MTYTPFPMPPVDTLHSHDGFVAVLLLGGVLTFVLSMIAWASTDKTWPAKLIGATWLVCVCWAGWVSWTTGTITPYRNEPVTAQLVGYVAEGYATVERSGKTGTKDVPHHYTYVVYSVQGTRVIFRTEPGQPWPERATLYRN